MVQINKLTVLGISKTRLPGYYVDGGGLLLQVSRTGTKSWLFRYTLHGKRHEMGLGTCSVIDLARARELARDCRLLIFEGADPLAARRAAATALVAENAKKMTFDQCAAAYIAAHRGSWRNPKHAAQWCSTLATYVSPVIGALPVAEVDTHLVVRVLTPIWNTKTETAKALNVQRLRIMEADEIDPRSFDTLVEMIAASPADVIIDNGASSFVPLSHFLISNQVPSLLVAMGHELVVHTIVTGGQALLDTVSGFAQLARQFPQEALFVVWLNPYWGAVAHEGKAFEQMKAYTDNKARVSALIQIPALKKETYGRDLSDML